MHVSIKPPILYFGTPVVLVSTLNHDGTPNLAPMSSAWALGWTVVLGLSKASQTTANLERTAECVLNLPSADLWPAVERLAPLTGRNPVPDYKRAYGARYERRKFESAGLTPVRAECVAPPGVAECPLQLEARVRSIRDLTDDPSQTCIEVGVVRVHAEERLVVPGTNHIAPDSWRPLIYNFRHYFGLGPALGRTFRARAG
jgi:flavin reductase (DIM6/NTAB) family NADH-FMN oxidoreductase RutF